MSKTLAHIEIHRDEDGTLIDFGGTVENVLDCLANASAACISNGYSSEHDRTAATAAFSMSVLHYLAETEGSSDGTE